MQSEQNIAIKVKGLERKREEQVLAINND